MLVDATSVTLGSIIAEFSKSDLKILGDWLEKLSIIVESGVQSVGPPASYALTWEWGNIRQTKKGPKTTKGKNPNGKSVWLSIQAPRGWISINEPKMWNIIESEFGKVSFNPTGNGDDLRKELERAYRTISEKCLELLQQTVPIDSGELYDSLEVVPPGSDILNDVADLSGDIVNTITGALNI